MANIDTPSWLDAPSPPGPDTRPNRSSGRSEPAARQEATEVAKDQVAEVTQQAKAQAQRLATTSRAQLRAQADQQARRLGEGLLDVGRQLDDMANCGAATGVVRDVTSELAWAASRRGTRLSQG